jgi:epoxyqueuosine reductase
MSVDLADFIRQKAMALGCSAVGIIPALPAPPQQVDYLTDWLQQHYHAEMGWMANHFEKRINPAGLMENTQSIVCVAMNYYVPDDYDPEDSSALKIAKYARGSDYHKVVKKVLKQLLKAIQEVAPHVSGRPLTDSAPIMEKPLSVQAGLGWIGKNGTLILPGKGSWYFLGELLLDIPLETISSRQEVPNHCGSCTRCIEACPTDAIVNPAVIDANRCIAYWTIEYKGDQIPEPITENLNGWIFGCDICQDVCPWNVRFAKPTAIEAFQPRTINRKPDAETLLSLDQETFSEVFQASPIKRAQLAGLHRNVNNARR